MSSDEQYDAVSEPQPAPAQTVEKKKRGRPSGSKNKKTLALESFIGGIHVEKVEKPKRANLYKTLKREQAAITIQKYARRFTVDYQVMLTRHTEH